VKLTNKIIGVVYPVPQQLVDRLFVAHRNIFVKYIPRATNLRIAPKHKVFFYASHASKEVVGEGTIEAIEFLTPNEALDKYREKVFLNKDELTEYTMRQPKRTSSKKLLTITLSKIRRYPKGIKYERPMTMAGEYLTQEKYNVLMEKVSRE